MGLPLIDALIPLGLPAIWTNAPSNPVDGTSSELLLPSATIATMLAVRASLIMMEILECY